MTEIKNLVNAKYDLIKKFDKKEVTKEEYDELMTEIEKQILILNHNKLEEKMQSINIDDLTQEPKPKKIKPKKRKTKLKITTDSVFFNHLVDALQNRIVTSEHKLVKVLLKQYPYKSEMEILNEALPYIKKIKDGYYPNIKWNFGKYSVIKIKQTKL